MLILCLPVAVAVPWSLQRLPLARAEDLCECISWLPVWARREAGARVETQASFQTAPDKMARDQRQGNGSQAHFQDICEENYV